MPSWQTLPLWSIERGLLLSSLNLFGLVERLMPVCPDNDYNVDFRSQYPIPGIEPGKRLKVAIPYSILE